MIKKTLFSLAIFIGFLLGATTALAVEPSCVPGDKRVECIFGEIKPPPVLENFLKLDPTGAGAISNFLSNGVILIYSIAAIVLIFMILWGALEWLTSGGDKEKLASAQRRILHAIIGIILFAIAFAVIRVLGVFTGFRFFEGQNYSIVRQPDGTFYYKCPDGSILWPPQKSPICEGHGG